MIAVFYLVLQILKLYSYVVIANVIISWLISFRIINTSNVFVYSILEFTYKLTEPFLSRIRRFLPNLKKVKFTSELMKRSLKLTVSNAGVRSVDKKGSFDEYLKTVKNKNLSPRLKKLKKGILIKSPFKKKPLAKSA